ncbi:DNA methyltransferase [Mesorhizobium yinganensis]|uniref:DNA methyltransferase n=1 Tax=Mesorhizobium yinganensis TaxID=3157707 RepID=UPI0032B855EB
MVPQLGTYFGLRRRTRFTYPDAHRLHPRQKPVDSMIQPIKSFCPSGGLALDPFCGSGSTLVAARDCGRDWLGIEFDGRPHATATERLRQGARSPSGAS